MCGGGCAALSGAGKTLVASAPPADKVWPRVRAPQPPPPPATTTAAPTTRTNAPPSLSTINLNNACALRRPTLCLGESLSAPAQPHFSRVNAPQSAGRILSVGGFARKLNQLEVREREAAAVAPPPHRPRVSFGWRRNERKHDFGPTSRSGATQEPGGGARREMRAARFCARRLYQSKCIMSIWRASANVLFGVRSFAASRRRHSRTFPPAQRDGQQLLATQRATFAKQTPEQHSATGSIYHLGAFANWQPPPTVMSSQKGQSLARRQLTPTKPCQPVDLAAGRLCGGEGGGGGGGRRRSRAAARVVSQRPLGESSRRFNNAVAGAKSSELPADLSNVVAVPQVASRRATQRRSKILRAAGSRERR